MLKNKGVIYTLEIESEENPSIIKNLKLVSVTTDMKAGETPKTTLIFTEGEVTLWERITKWARERNWLRVG